MTEEDKQLRNLKFEVRRLRERVDKLEQTTEKDREIISLLLKINDYLFDYIKDTAQHVIQLEKEEKEVTQ